MFKFSFRFYLKFLKYLRNPDQGLKIGNDVYFIRDKNELLKIKLLNSISYLVTLLSLKYMFDVLTSENARNVIVSIVQTIVVYIAAIIINSYLVYQYFISKMSKKE